MKTWLHRFLFALLTGLLPSGLMAQEAADHGEPVKVFWLAGQSNMEGQGVVDLDHEKHYNGGRGILTRVMTNPAMSARYRHLRHPNGEWVVRNDVFVRFRTAREIRTGGLTIGFTGYPGRHHIGPELQFGHVVGDAFSEPVLIIKTAWGGKSLHVDFRPPSAGGATGPWYQKMLKEFEGVDLAGIHSRLQSFLDV